MDGPRLILLVLAFAFAASIYFTFNHRSRAAARRLADTLPSVEEVRTAVQEEGEKEKQEEESAPDYSDIYPPSRRHTLLEILPKLPKDHPFHKRSKSSLEHGEEEANATTSNRKDVPLTVPDRELEGDEVTPTGFTVEEVRQLGDFPDYASLSGIPLPEAYKEFDIARALPRPYRPFRWPYHQTMSLSKLDHDFWLELESQYKSKIPQRKELYAKHGGLVFQQLPGSEMACKELMEMAVQFLCARYPMYFSLEERDGVHVLKNGILNTETKIDGSLHPLFVLLEHIPEDFAIMIRDPESGRYHLRAGVICSALGWSIGSKIGLRLHEVHGPIPDYKEKMQFSMDRYFAKKPTDRAIQRGSWGFEVDSPLFMPPGDPHEKYRDYQEPSMTLDRLHLRVDWQTLRRLPLSGAIIFNFKGLFTPLEEFRDEPYIPSIALKVLDEGKQNIMDYKNTWHTEHVSRPALQSWEAEQENDGKKEKNWEVKTLEHHPFYPGWEEKWRRQQGF